MSRARAFFILGLIAALIAVFPVLTATVGIGVADAAGCAVTAAGVQSCIIFGYELKDPIYAVSMSYWLLMFTALYVPIALGLFFAAFAMRRKGGVGDNPHPTVGLRFWLVAAGFLILPLFKDIALLLMTIAALHYAIGRWRNREQRGSYGPD